MKKTPKPQENKKVSEMLAALGGGFVQLGTTPEERENYYRTVATAWNIACLNERLRESCIADSIWKFIEVNGADKQTAKAYEHNLRQLIGRKLTLFPLAKVQVLDVRVLKESGQEKLMAVSQRM